MKRMTYATPALEQRVLALATVYGMNMPYINVCRTPYEDTFNASVRDDASRMGLSVTRDTVDAAVEALRDRLVESLRECIKNHRAYAAHHTTKADSLDAALMAALEGV